jgi:CRP-like cAMP-binding protein
MNNISKSIEAFFPNLESTKVPRRTLLLREGEISRHIFLLEEGIARMWFNKDGKDITFQFFFAGSGMSSIESLLENKPSSFNIETINPCIIKKIKREDFLAATASSTTFDKFLIQAITKRLLDYQQLFLSRIKDNPQKRYELLMKEHPEILLNIPQHYIASYLGITSVSLSRIRNRKKI